ncbi:hypothetical protein BGZ46_000260 [Entomortierella lignicola]|nr:hypothetical protein BGZ46_000260 [Entomortierella lignicola]
MVPANTDVDMRPVTPPPLEHESSSSDLNVHINKEMSPPVEELSNNAASQVQGKEGSSEKAQTLNGTGDKSAIAPSSEAIKGNTKDLDNNTTQNGSQKPIERKTKKREDERESGRSHRHDKTGHHQMNDSPLSYQDDDHDMDQDSRQPTDEKYRRLKRKLKEVLEENERLSVELDRSNRRARNLRQEKNLLLDRLCAYERDSDSSPDSLSSISSDSDLSDSSLISYNRSRRTSPSERVVATAAAKKSQNLRVPAAVKNAEPSTSASHSTHHPKKTAAKAAAPRKSPALVRKEEKPPSIPSTITTVGSATQKPKRIHNTSKLRPALSNKVRKVQAIERDEAGNVKLPVTVGIITIMSLGHVVYDREAFHNERYIWPVGYKMSRSYNSMIDPQQQTTYTCSVIDDGEAPKFQIDAEDQPGNPIIAGTATGAWTHVVKTANQIRKRDHSNSASGPDYFGFSNATIAKMIQDLPNADKCKTYIMQRYEEPSAKPGSSSFGSKLEKRKISTASSKVNEKSSGNGGDAVDNEGGEEHSDDGHGEEDGDEHVSLGTPGRKKAKHSSLSPKNRPNESDMEGVEGKEVEEDEIDEIEEEEEEEEEVEVDELEDDDTLSEKEVEDVDHGLSNSNVEQPNHSSTASTGDAATPTVVITSAEKSNMGAESQATEMEVDATEQNAKKVE